MQLGSSQWCMMGEQDGAEAETREAQGGDKEETLIMMIIKQWNGQPRERSLSLEVSRPDWIKRFARYQWAEAEVSTF